MHVVITGASSGIGDAVEEKEPRIIYPFMNALGRHFPALTRVVLDAFTPKIRRED